MAEPVEMPFGLRTRMGPRNRVLREGSDPLWEGAILGERSTHCKVCGHSAVTCAKIAEPIMMQFVLSAQSGSKNHEIHGDPDPPREAAIVGERVAHCKV